MTARLTVTRRRSSPRDGNVWTWTLDVVAGPASVLATGSAESSAHAIGQAAELCARLGVDTPPARGPSTRLVAALAREAGRDRPVAPLGDTAGGWRG